MKRARRLAPIFPWLLSALFLATGCAGTFDAAHDKNRSASSNLERLASEAHRARERIQAQLSQSPDSELRESLRMLDSILDYAEKVKADPSQFDPEKIDAYNRKIRIIQGNIERFKDPAFQTSIAFPGGAYRIDGLPAGQKAKLQRLAATVSRTVEDLHRRYPTHSIRITFKSVGHTDENPIAAGSRLEAAIQDEIDDLAPSGPARRRQYNQILSRLRATNANQFVLGQTRSGLADASAVEFVQKITGMGENLPSQEVSPPYRRIDPRRRVCRVSAFIEIVL